MIPIYPEEIIFLDDSTLTRTRMQNVARSQNEVGPVKTKKIACKPMIRITFVARICEADFEQFDEWFSKDIGDGSKWFLMKDPYNGQEYRFRFIETELQWQKVKSLLSTTFVLERMDV